MTHRRRPRIIPAQKGGWPQALVHALILWKLKRGLFAIRAQGLEQLRATFDEDPSGTLFLANHSCWWDFFLAHFLNSVVPVDGYGMTEYSNMRKFGFFRRIGAFSVDRADPLAVRASIDYVVELLKRPRAGVWFFPQGKIVCNDLRPLEFQGGLRLIVRRARRVRVVPVALRYEFWQDEHPEACVRLGEAFWVERDNDQVLDLCRDRLTDELDRLRMDSLTQDPQRFTTLLQGRDSIHDRYAKATRALRGLGPNETNGPPGN